MENKPESSPSLILSEQLSRMNKHLDAVNARLMRMPYGLFILCGVLCALLLSLLFFSPKFWLMQTPLPGTFEWDRALTFLHQCKNPFDQKIEPAMRWRFLPPLAANLCGLTTYNALALPFLGLAAFLAYWLHVSTRILDSRFTGLLLTILLVTTSGIITITNWLGMNDAWFLIGLVAVSCGRNKLSLILPGLLAPWIDERFLLGWPLALFCRWWLQGQPSDFKKDSFVAVTSLFPYLIARGIGSFLTEDKTSADFLANTLFSIPVYFSHVPLGWWMGLRSAWLLVLLAALGWCWSKSKLAPMAGFACLFAGMGSITLLAADLSRSTNLLFPLLLCGACTLRRDPLYSLHTNLWLFFCVLFNLLTPYISITYTHVVLTWPLPFEAIRFFKNTL